MDILTWLKGFSILRGSSGRVNVAEQLVSVRDQRAEHIKSLLRGVSDDFEQLRKEIHRDTSS